MEQKMNGTADTFSYHYSAKEQVEIKNIADKYRSTTEREQKMEQLRRLDAGVTTKGRITSMTVGVLGALVLGLGMSCCMVWSGIWFVPGILIGVVGMAGIAAAYPLYRRMTEKEKERVAPQILSLAEELKHSFSK